VIKKILLSAAVILLISGCSDKKEEETVNPVAKKEVVQQAPLKIEIEQNDNAQEIKVVEKKKVSKENETYYFNYKVQGEYDPDSKPANEDAKVRLKPRSNIEANMHVRSPYERVKVSLLVKQLSKDFIVKCSACHNDYANGVIGPSLLDKDSEFIYNSIMKFKNNKDANVLMTGLVNQMSDEEIRKIANEIYDFNKQIREMK